MDGLTEESLEAGASESVPSSGQHRGGGLLYVDVDVEYEQQLRTTVCVGRQHNRLSIEDYLATSIVYSEFLERYNNCDFA